MTHSSAGRRGPAPGRDSRVLPDRIKARNRAQISVDRLRGREAQRWVVFGWTPVVAPVWSHVGSIASSHKKTALPIPALKYPQGRCRGLLLRSGTGDQDVHQPLRALLPVGAGGDVRDADQGSQQIQRIQVVADVAALDGSLYQ